MNPWLSMMLMKSIMGKWKEYTTERKNKKMKLKSPSLTSSYVSSDDYSEDDEVASLGKSDYAGPSVAQLARRRTTRGANILPKETEDMARRLRRKSLLAPKVNIAPLL